MNIFELTLSVKGFNLKKAHAWLSDVKYNRVRLRDSIVEYHKRHNPMYKDLLNGMDVKYFEDLPIVTKKDFHRPLKEMVSDEYLLKDLYIANTSGSSGHPFFYAKDKDSHAITHSIALQCYAQHGITPKLKQARFYGIPASGISKYKEILKDILSNRVRFPIFDLSDENLECYLSKFKKIKFGYIYGYTSAIVIFARYLLRHSMVLKDICPSLKACIVTSEVCTNEDRDVISKAFGVKVINEYGCSETGLIAFEDIHGTWRMVEKNSYYEVVDAMGKPVPYGAEGRILITSLSNKAMPFIRYEVGDMGIIDKDKQGLVLKKLCGRVSDVIKLPSGKIAGGLTFYYVSRAIMEHNNFVREFIVRQIALDTFVFDVVTDKDLNSDEIKSLEDKLEEYLEPGLKLIINRVEKINRPASGKIKHFYSEIN
jgi:coenzyme F390 synthetase-like protein